MHSLGVVWGIARSILIVLSSILFSVFIWVLFVSHVSEPCVMIDIMHVSISVHIVSICVPLKLSRYRYDYRDSHFHYRRSYVTIYFRPLPT